MTDSLFTPESMSEELNFISELDTSDWGIDFDLETGLTSELMEACATENRTSSSQHTLESFGQSGAQPQLNSSQSSLPFDNYTSFVPQNPTYDFDLTSDVQELRFEVSRLREECTMRHKQILRLHNYIVDAEKWTKIISSMVDHHAGILAQLTGTEEKPQ